MKLFKVILLGHASYIFVTALWPLLHIQSFMQVTGPKTDIWLVKTIGALLIPVALCMISYLNSNTDKRPVYILGAGTAIVFICVDVYYSGSGVISDIYLADALLEFVFLAGWTYLGITKYNM